MINDFTTIWRLVYVCCKKHFKIILKWYTNVKLFYEVKQGKVACCNLVSSWLFSQPLALVETYSFDMTITEIEVLHNTCQSFIFKNQLLQTNSYVLSKLYKSIGNFSL